MAFMPLRRAIRSGLWSQPATWEGNAVPQSGDDILIVPGVSVTFNIASFNGSSLTLQEGSSLKFLPSHVCFLSFNNVTLASSSEVDIITIPGENDNGFIDFVVNQKLHIESGAVWFGNAALSPRISNFFSGEWGLTVKLDTPPNSTQLQVVPSESYTIRPALVPLLTNRTLIIAGRNTLTSHRITAASFSNETLSLTVSPAIPIQLHAGDRCLIVPDPFSTHINLALTNLTVPHLAVSAATIQITNSPTVSLFVGHGIVWNTTVGTIKGRSFFYVDTRNSGTQPKQISATKLNICETRSISYDIAAEKITIEHIGGNISNATIVCHELFIATPRTLQGNNFNANCELLRGYLSLGFRNCSLKATRLNLETIEWTPEFDPSTSTIQLGNENDLSTVNTEPNWEQFISDLLSPSFGGRTGYIEIINCGSLHRLKADYARRDFTIYLKTYKPCLLDTPYPLRTAKDFQWGRPLQHGSKSSKSVPYAFGALWEKDESAITSSEPPSFFSPHTGKEVFLLPGKPHYEVLENASQTVTYKLPSAGRFWFFNERHLQSIGDEPWVIKENDELRVITPATSSSMEFLAVKTHFPVSEFVAKGWRWKYTMDEDLCEVAYYLTKPSSRIFAAIILRQFSKGWQCKGLFWQFPTIDNNNHPATCILSRPTLSAIGKYGATLGLTYYTYVKVDNNWTRLAFRDDLLSDWKEKPIPTPIPVEVSLSNFNIHTARLHLNTNHPFVEVYDGTTLLTIEVDEYNREYEKIFIKSKAEVNKMFAANLRARLIITGSATTGEFKSSPNDKFAIVFIAVSGRGRVVFWDWTNGTYDPNNNNHLALAKLIVEVNSTSPTVMEYSPIMFPMGLYIVGTKAANDPYLAVFVYSD